MRDTKSLFQEVCFGGILCNVSQKNSLKYHKYRAYTPQL